LGVQVEDPESHLKNYARIAQLVERIIGNDEVSGSTPDVSTIHVERRL
jgi:hypothetical protein